MFPSALLNLPPEMRNRIYEDSLIEKGLILVTKDLKIPALLHASRQTRKEAVPIWHLRNRFRLPISDCDSSLFQTYMTKVMKPLETEFGTWLRLPTLVAFGNRKVVWHDLVQWCKAVWAAKVPGLELTSNSYLELAIIRAALNIARMGRDLPWLEVLSQLEGVRIIAGSLGGFEAQLGSIVEFPRWVDPESNTRAQRTYLGENHM